MTHLDSPDSSQPAPVPAGYDVFVSHSSKDRDAADAVSRALESRGIRCWMAPRDIRPGANWGESILEAIGQVKMMVLLLSANANASPQVLREVERAVNKSVAIIPVRIENVMPSASLEFFLSTAHWLDAFESPLEQHCRHLADTVQGMLRGKDFTPLASATAAAPARRASRAWLVPVAGVAGVLAIAAMSFAAGHWWRQSKQPAESSAAQTQFPGPFIAVPAPVPLASPSVAQRPAPVLEDFAGQWEISVMSIQDVAGNRSSYGPIRFAVARDGRVIGKAALQSEEIGGRFELHRPPRVLDVTGIVSSPKWKDDFPGYQHYGPLGYRVADIALTLSDGASGKGLLGISEGGRSSAEQITLSKGEAFGQMYSSRTGPLEDAAAGQIPSVP